MTILVIKYIAANIYCPLQLQNPMPIKKGIIKTKMQMLHARHLANIQTSNHRPFFHPNLYTIISQYITLRRVWKTLTSIFPISLPSLLATSVALANNKSKSS